MPSILRRVGAWLRRERLARELDEELDTHRMLLAERLRQDGMEGGAAGTASRRAMGNTTLAREEARAAWIAAWLDSVGQDARYAYVVQQRTHEIGIRMALGARGMDVGHVVVRSSLLAIGTGVVAGAAGSFLSSAWLRSYLLGLSPIDPLAHGSVADRARVRRSRGNVPAGAARFPHRAGRCASR